MYWFKKCCSLNYMEYEEKEIKQQKNNKKFKEKIYQLIINKFGAHKNKSIENWIKYLYRCLIQCHMVNVLGKL